MKKERITIAVRCPVDLLNEVDLVAHVLGMSRTQFVSESIRIFLRHLREQEGFLVPPYHSRKPL